MSSSSYILFDNSSGSSNSLHESVELRSRSKNQHSNTASDPWRQESPHSNGSSRLQLLEHNVKNGESLMQISLLYSVPVSEIKRVNNIVADQEIHAFPVIKVPLSRTYLLKRQLIEQQQSNQLIEIEGEKQNISSEIGNGQILHLNLQNENLMDSVPLKSSQNSLNGSENSQNSPKYARQTIEGILDEADKTVAAIRQNLPSPSLEGGQFHFVDAGVPDNSSNMWIILIIVIVIFVLLPLGLTLLEEAGELGEERQQQQNHHQNN
uniref:LysM domain-containing protein n=2 Tax=Meloidogyne TaxID=189290 RepID=A0A915NND0_9BILA